MQEVCATYQISEDDLLEGQVSHAGKLYRVGQVAGAILIAVGFAGILVIRPMNYGPVIPLLAGLFLMFRLRLVTRLSFGRDFAGKGNVDVRVTSSGIALRTTNVTADLSWSAFERFVESKHLVILYGQSNIFHLAGVYCQAPAHKCKWFSVKGLPARVCITHAGYYGVRPTRVNPRDFVAAGFVWKAQWRCVADPSLPARGTAVRIAGFG